jgi:hypothetical protein
MLADPEPTINSDDLPFWLWTQLKLDWEFACLEKSEMRVLPC